jgi:hypothetical protein
MEVCVAKTLQLLDQEKNNDEIVSYLEQAANQGSGIGAYMLWLHTKSTMSVSTIF